MLFSAVQHCSLLVIECVSLSLSLHCHGTTRFKRIILNVVLWGFFYALHLIDGETSNLYSRLNGAPFVHFGTFFEVKNEWSSLKMTHTVLETVIRIAFKKELCCFGESTYLYSDNHLQILN